MPSVFAANAVPIGPDYSAASTFPSVGFWQDTCNKLDAFVNGTDAVFQLLTEQGGWTEDIAQEVLMRMGFNGRDPLPVFYAVRFRVWPGTALASSGTVDMSAYSV